MTMRQSKCIRKIFFNANLVAVCIQLLPAARIYAEKPAAMVEQLDFLSFDTETTGFGAWKNRIIELGAIRFRGTNILEQKSWLINPEQPISYFATKAHGITDEMVQDQPLFADILPEFKAMTSNCILMAHNARFDVDFMKAEMERAGIQPLNVTVIDTLSLFRNWFKDSEAHNIAALVKHLSIEAKGYHRALIDSYYIIRIFNKGLDRKADGVTLDKLFDESKTLHF